MTITLTFDRSNGDTAFEAELLIPHLGPGNYLKITIFGEEFEVSFPLTIGPFNFSQLEYLISNDLSKNQVVIEYIGAPILAPGPEVLGFAIRSYDNVLNGI